ncbi:endoglucanase [Dictyobacter alpinus]|uniref:Endoglucanase n=1 Tax=Dictyobacter alpinus TaxID=2014873 RepID=A0A402BG47_9CHLR|nr:glycoside hydrolase family 44 protein [Dictyobacter alpinus]GCE30323.1 endoglucanase [Dictyobacter alpinus]GCE30355.1 endoglucanase [Dictyobacter alpinus]
MLLNRNDSAHQQRQDRALMPRRLTSLILISVVLLTTVIAFFVPGTRTIFAAGNGPALTVDAQSNRHTISRDIYGMNLYAVDENLAKELKLSNERMGGNNTSTYNWQIDSSNAGNDYFYEGGGDGVYMGGSNAGTGSGNGASVDRFVNNMQAQGTKAMITIPMLPYLTKTRDMNCSYPKSNYQPQQYYSSETLPNGDTCGNGHDTSGNPINDNNPTLNYTANSPDIAKAWTQHLVQTHGTTANGGVGVYEMDNEPSIWYSTHQDVHPGYTGFDELVNVTQDYAKAVKGVDSSAVIAGPGDFGWWGYIGAQAPAGDGQTDHNNLWRVQYYLQQMKAYQDRTGTRLLDYLTEHYYPNTRSQFCLSLCDAGNSANQQERLNSTRSLWDPTYVDNSWIGDQYGAINLIPRMHDWVNTYYPGTKIGLTEYNFGGNESLNGALTEADVLGIFGRENLDYATMWGPPTSGQPAAYAFRMYLNYDGNGSSYGDTWINSSSSDQSQLAVYGAQRSSDNALTLMVINKTGNDLTSNLALSNATPSGNAQVYTYSGANLNTIVHQPDMAVKANGFSTTYPANSISMIVIPTGTSTGGGGGTSQFSTGLENGNVQPSWTNTVDAGNWPLAGAVNVTGVCCGLSSPELGVRNENAHGGSAALMYSGSSTNAFSSNYAYLKSFDLSSQNVVVGSNTTLSYWIYPQSSASSNLVHGNNSTCVAIDLIFQANNGSSSNLRDSQAVDQNGNRAHPAYQCGKLTQDTWNHVTINLGTHSNALKVSRVDVGYDNPNSTGGYRGYIDDISISG